MTKKAIRVGKTIAIAGVTNVSTTARSRISSPGGRVMRVAIYPDIPQLTDVDDDIFGDGELVITVRGSRSSAFTRRARRLSKH